MTSKVTPQTALRPALHGGDIVSASEQYPIDIDKWIDLSTGLNPDSYPVDNLPASVFQHLPYLQPQFIAASKHYYKSEQSIALIGSQMLIQNLPQCVQKRPVLLPDVGYNEHRQSWSDAGFELHDYPAFELQDAKQFIDNALQNNSDQHLVIINPNNPSGLLIDPEQLIIWAKELSPNCYVIVDEAFIDMRPDMSVLRHQWPKNMLVLRSFGKFFGLAGIRIGFAFCQGALKQKIEQVLGLWMINGPAQYLAAKAMQDDTWQREAIGNIERAACTTQQIFKPMIEYIHSITTAKDHWYCHQALFSSYKMPEAIALAVQHHFAKSGILLRVIKLPDNDQTHKSALLRIGVLAKENKQQHSAVIECIEHFIKQAANTSDR